MWGGRVSIAGIYNLNKHVFDGLVMPGDLSKERFIELLYADAAELECCYTEPYIMQQLIASWSESQNYEWTKLYETMNLEYNPIWNYDRTEEENEGQTGSSTGSSQGSSTGSGTTQNDVTGFNTDSFSPSTRQSGTSTNTASSSSTSSARSDRSRRLRAYGNIGVTSAMDMISQQRDIVKFNLYDIMINEFINKFCVQVY